MIRGAFERFQRVDMKRLWIFRPNVGPDTAGELLDLADVMMRSECFNANQSAKSGGDHFTQILRPCSVIVADHPALHGGSPGNAPGLPFRGIDS